MDPEWVVYVIQSLKDGTYYIGITNNFAKRLKAHNLNLGAKRTRGRGPWSPSCVVSAGSKPCALKLEIKLKKLSRKGKEDYISSIILLQQLQNA